MLTLLTAVMLVEPRILTSASLVAWP